jgi:hypothetical protein
MVQYETATKLVRLLVEVIDAVGVEQRGAPLDTVHFIALAKQEFRQISAILPGNACNQSDFPIAFQRILLEGTGESAAPAQSKTPTFLAQNTSTGNHPAVGGPATESKRTRMRHASRFNAGCSRGDFHAGTFGRFAILPTWRA